MKINKLNKINNFKSCFNICLIAILLCTFCLPGNAFAQSESDGCIPCSACDTFELWRFMCTFISQICTIQSLPAEFCEQQRELCDQNIDDLIVQCREICDANCDDTETCPDGTCATGENCPADAADCEDRMCFEPTCENGCDEAPVPSGSTDEACNDDEGCSASSCSCDGQGNCVPSDDCQTHENPSWLDNNDYDILVIEEGCTDTCGTEYLIELREKSTPGTEEHCGDQLWVWLEAGTTPLDTGLCYRVVINTDTAPSCGHMITNVGDEKTCPECEPTTDCHTHEDPEWIDDIHILKFLEKGCTSENGCTDASNGISTEYFVEVMDNDHCGENLWLWFDDSTSPNPPETGKCYSSYITMYTGNCNDYVIRYLMSEVDCPQCEPSDTCPNDECATGENCPADAGTCPDNVCMTPTCEDGCGQTPVTNAEDPGQCDETETPACPIPPCICNVNSECVPVEEEGCRIEISFNKDEFCPGDNIAMTLEFLEEDTHVDYATMTATLKKPDSTEKDLSDDFKKTDTGVYVTYGGIGTLTGDRILEVEAQFGSCNEEASASYTVHSEDDPECQDREDRDCSITTTFDKDYYCEGEDITITTEFRSNDILTEPEYFAAIIYNESEGDEITYRYERESEGIYVFNEIVGHGGYRTFLATARFEDSCHATETQDFFVYSAYECPDEPEDDCACADITLDGFVNIDDVNIIDDCLNTCSGDSGYDPRADLTGDDCADSDDILCAVDQWGETDCAGVDPECTTDDDCPTGQECIDGACVGEPQVIFDSGRGTGPYDKMTYWHYYSEIYFTPNYDMTITAIDPDVYYCNGECYFNAIIYDEQGNKLGEAEDEGSSPEQFDGILASKVTLSANKKYLIYEHAWTTKSVGIYTSGGESPKKKDSGWYEIIYAKSNSANHDDRGPISFKLRGSYKTSQCSDKKTMTPCLDISTCYWDQETGSCKVFDSTMQLCSDPDGGKNYAVRAHTYGFREHAADERDARIRTGGRDACVSGKLREHYCVDSYHIETIDVSCQSGEDCEDGACLEDTECSSKTSMTPCLDISTCYWDQETDSCKVFDSTMQLCSDPDSGKNYAVRAHTYGFREHAADERDARIRTGGRDACVSGKLREHYCVDSYHIETIDVACQSDEDCEDGACIDQTPRPDFTVTDISWSPANPKVGDGITFYSKIKNIGDTVERCNGCGFKVCDYIDDRTINCNSVGNAWGTEITAGEEHTMSWSRTAGWPNEFSAGSHTFGVEITETFGITEESDTTNNKLTETFTVTQPCTITSASITPWCAGDSSDCESSESIHFEVTYKDCPATIVPYIQIDAESGGSENCRIRYTGGDMSGIYSGTSGLTGEWTILAIPDNCKGKLMTPTKVGLYDGGPPGTGEGLAWSDDISDTFKFAESGVKSCGSRGGVCCLFGRVCVGTTLQNTDCDECCVSPGKCVEANPKPDLAVIDIKLLDVSGNEVITPMVGAEYTFASTIKNIGNADLDKSYQVRFSDNGDVSNTIKIYTGSSLKADESQTVTHTYTFSNAKTYSIILFVDDIPDDTTESDETNNMGTETFTVTEPCTITSAKITPWCAGGSLECETTEEIYFEIAYEGNCPDESDLYIQIDAVNSDGGCKIQYDNNNMKGIHSGVPGSTGLWEIPTIPTECKDQTMSATEVGLYSGGYPGAGGTWEAGSDITGWFEFSPTGVKSCGAMGGNCCLFGKICTGARILYSDCDECCVSAADCVDPPIKATFDVRDSSNNPVSGAEVSVSNLVGTDWLDQCTTDRTGKCIIYGAEKDRGYNYQIDTTGYTTYLDRFNIDEDTTITVTLDGGVATIKVTFDVRDSSGISVIGAEVSVSNLVGTDWLDQCTIDSTGKCIIYGAEKDRNYNYQVDKLGYTSSLGSFRTSVDTTRTITLDKR